MKLGLAAGCWVVSVWQMSGMGMGVATRLGSFALFAAVWVVMMLPDAAPAVARAARAGGERAALFAVPCLAVWAPLAGSRADDADVRSRHRSCPNRWRNRKETPQ